MLTLLFSLLFSTCIPAKNEPLLNSSSCYPLLNFTRPFCRGVPLSDYVYKPPRQQRFHNDYANNFFDNLFKAFKSKPKPLLVGNATIRECANAFVPFLCHLYFPSCDQTQDVIKEQKICHETCLNLLHKCQKLFKKYEILKIYTTFHPDSKSKKFVHCDLQPYRHAGDSPECWYSDLENFTGIYPHIILM